MISKKKLKELFCFLIIYSFNIDKLVMMKMTFISVAGPQANKSGRSAHIHALQSFYHGLRPNLFMHSSGPLIDGRVGSPDL